MSRIMSLDVGDKTIGIAMSDEGKIISSPFENYNRLTVKKDIDYLIDLVLIYDISNIVIGMPYNMNGEMGVQAEKTLSFAKKLLKTIKYSNRTAKKNIEIDFEDERMSSIEARELLRNQGVSPKKIKDMIDKMAAQIILEAYLKRFFK